MIDHAWVHSRLLPQVQPRETPTIAVLVGCHIQAGSSPHLPPALSRVLTLQMKPSRPPRRTRSRKPAPPSLLTWFEKCMQATLTVLHDKFAEFFQTQRKLSGWGTCWARAASSGSTSHQGVRAEREKDLRANLCFIPSLGVLNS
jgi:hypothetical protein